MVDQARAGSVRISNLGVFVSVQFFESKPGQAFYLRAQLQAGRDQGVSISPAVSPFRCTGSVV